MEFDMTDSKDFLTVAELADLWRCTAKHIYNLVDRGDLPAVRIGKRVIVARNAALAYSEKRATMHTMAAA
jgi:excisionase family DNA binding protein